LVFIAAGKQISPAEGEILSAVFLEEQKAEAASIEREFSAYKEEHKMSGDLRALQDAVALLQDQLRGKKTRKKQ